MTFLARYPILVVLIAFIGDIMSINYIDNKEFLIQITEYCSLRNLAIKNNTPLPKIPDYLGLCFIKIAENLIRKPNFNGYTFKEELVLDAIENCVRACHKFDPEISSNPFAYFTQITWYAFLRRIASEKKQLYVKYKITEKNDIIDASLLENDTGEQKPFGLYSNLCEYIDDYEEGIKRKKDKHILKNVDIVELDYFEPTKDSKKKNNKHNKKPKCDENDDF